MRLAKPATVSNYERLKTVCVGVTADSVIRLFFFFFFSPHRSIDAEVREMATDGFIHYLLN